MKNLFDSHTHLLDSRLIDSVDNQLKEVAGVLCVYSPHEDFNQFSRLLSKEKVWGSAGIHPHDASRTEDMWPYLEDVLKQDKVVSLGEIGLDFHYMNSPTEVQKEVFRKQLKLAADRSLPVIVHSRDAFKETLNILDEISPVRAVIHCFTGSKIEMYEYLQRGFSIGLGGVVTFSKSDSLKEAVKELPLENILIETDCPYLAPEPKRGKINKPSYLKHIVDKIASLKKTSPDKIANQTYKNTRKFFNLR